MFYVNYYLIEYQMHQTLIAITHKQKPLEL